MPKDFYDDLIRCDQPVDFSGSFLYGEPVITNENFSLCADLPTAKEARQMVYDINEGKYKEELNKIKGAIEKAIKEGSDHCYYYKPLSKCAINILKQYGYDVREYVSSRNETTITITWGEVSANDILK